jgi:hypothetical protein
MYHPDNACGEGTYLCSYRARATSDIKVRAWSCILCPHVWLVYGRRLEYRYCMSML